MLPLQQTPFPRRRPAARATAHTDYLSFGFKERSQAIAALSEIGRSELAEEAFVMDPAKTRAALSAPTGIIRDARTFAKVIRQERSLLHDIRSGVKLALVGRDFIQEGCYSLHMFLCGDSRNRRSYERLTADVGESTGVDIGGRDLRVGLNSDVMAAVERTIPLGRAGTPEDAAGAVFLFCQPETDYVSGQTILCSGGLTGL